MKKKATSASKKPHPALVSEKTIRRVFGEALKSKESALAYLKSVGITFKRDGSVKVRPL